MACGPNQILVCDLELFDPLLEALQVVVMLHVVLSKEARQVGGVLEDLRVLQEGKASHEQFHRVFGELGVLLRQVALVEEGGEGELVDELVAQLKIEQPLLLVELLDEDQAGVKVDFKLVHWVEGRDALDDAPLEQDRELLHLLRCARVWHAVELGQRLEEVNDALGTLPIALEDEVGLRDELRPGEVAWLLGVFIHAYQHSLVSIIHVASFLRAGRAFRISVDYGRLFTG